jgi:multisubunit Na+/H+ antiporter MnhE subunit
MLRAAAAFAGLFLIWLLTTQHVGSGDFAIAALAVAGALLLGAHFGGGVSGGFVHAPRLVLLGLSRVNTVLAGAASTVRAALAADVALTPGLARLKTRSADADARADLATLVSTSPGAVVVEADAEGLLIHLIDESAAEASDLGELEARVLGAHGLKAPA